MERFYSSCSMAVSSRCLILAGLCALSAAFPMCPVQYWRGLLRASGPATSPAGLRRPLLRRACPVASTQRNVDVGENVSLAATVRQALQDGEGWPYFRSDGRIRLCERLVFSDGLQEFAGPESYVECAAAWRRQLLDEVPDAAVSIVNVAQIEPEMVTIRYNISWTPPNAAWLESLGKSVPGWRVVKMDLLHRLRERSVFKWRNLFGLFWRAATTGDLLVPLAVIQCTAALTFASDHPEAGPPVLVRHGEAFDLLQSVYTGELQNRALARDLLLFLDTRCAPSLRSKMRHGLPAHTFASSCCRAPLRLRSSAHAAPRIEVLALIVYSMLSLEWRCA